MKGKRTVWLLLAGLLILAAGLAAEWYFVIQPTERGAKLSSQSSKLQLSTVEGRYLFHGTVTWSRAVEKYAGYDYNQPFSQLDTFHREKYDAWAADFECPITKNVVPYQTQVDKLIFNCRPEFLHAASKYFTIYDLANNHTGDQGGEAGLTETRNNLEQVGAHYFGTPDSSDAKNVCEVLPLPVRVQQVLGVEQRTTIPVAFCGWQYFFKKPAAGEIAVMDEYAKYMPVFAFAEMGMEYKASADPDQQAIAHEIIDHAPEYLIANNPHWVQNTEVYKGKLIVYSTGNFIFDQNETETNRSASIDVGLKLPYDANVGKWLKLAPSCATFHDTCLAQAKQQGLKKVKLSLNYGVIAGQNGASVVTHKAVASTQQAVLERMNWSATCAKLVQPYGCTDQSKL